MNSEKKTPLVKKVLQMPKSNLFLFKLDNFLLCRILLDIQKLIL